MNGLNLLGWIGNGFYILGAYLLAENKRIGFICNLLANLIYLIIGLAFGISSLWGISIGLIVLNVHGIYNWKRKKYGL